MKNYSYLCARVTIFIHVCAQIEEIIHVYCTGERFLKTRTLTWMRGAHHKRPFLRLAIKYIVEDEHYKTHRLTFDIVDYCDLLLQK